jgi:glycosyltransferase involved in cell wall biosynthesis
MKIAYITAGAAGMVCGSCLRDNALAAALIAAGHEVHLIPIYTPTLTDEHNVSENRVFLGGINVYLQQHFGLFRKTPGFFDRLWDSVPILKLATRWGMQVAPDGLGDLTVSMLKGSDGFQHKEIQKLVRWLKDEISPDVINLPNSLMAGLAPEIKAVLDRPICCTLQGEDLFLQGLPEPYRSESLRLIRAHSEDIDAFIAVSHYCASFMSSYLGISRTKIHVVPLGINLDGHSPKETDASEPFTVGYLARIAPEKGLHVLCESYRRLRQMKDLPYSRLLAAGYLAPEHRPYLEDLQKKMASWGLSDQFSYRGVLDRAHKIAFLQSLSVLSVPSPYDEPKGIYLLEAMANGVPVVQPRRGAFTEIIEATGAGILVDPDDPDALARGILSLWEDPARRSELGRRGSEAVKKHFSAEKMAQNAVAVYQNLTTARDSLATPGGARPIARG